MATSPTIRVGIVVWNTADLIGRCLDALPAALDGAEANVVVVDNASSDGSGEVVRAHSEVRGVFNPENVGYAKAMNQALRGGDEQVLIAVNPDTEPPPGSLTALAGRLLDRPDVGLVTPRLTNGDGSLQHSVYTFPSPRQAAVVSFLPVRWQGGRIGRRFWLEGAVPHDRSVDIEWAIGAVHAIRAGAVDRDAVYSERWFMYVEDLDLCWRLAETGWRRRLEADIAVPHVGGAAAAQAWGDQRMRRYMPASYDWYARTHGRGAMRRWALVNAAGAAARGALLGAAGVAGRPGARVQGRALRGQLGVHLRAVAGRGGMPNGPPVAEESARPLAT